MLKNLQTTVMLLLGLVLMMVNSVHPAIAQNVTFLHCSAVTEAEVPVALYTLPDGQGHPFTEAQPLGGPPNLDATITVTILNADYQPIEHWGFEDIWLESEGGGLLLPCPAGTVADANTDENGQTTFQDPLLAAGANEPYTDLLQLMVSGLPAESPGLEIFICSPDINGDGYVALADVALFAEVYLDPADNSFYADYWWDGIVNISDLVLFAQGYAASCP